MKRKIKTTVGIAVLVVAVLLLAGCAVQSISDIKNEEMVGEQVTVTGTVKETLKIGDISGFTLEDDSGAEIKVASESLPNEGTSITVTGTVVHDSLFGYYIQRDE